MRPFDYVRTDDVAAAVALVSADPEATTSPVARASVVFVGTPDRARPRGVKGIGEIGVVGVSAAIANAAYHATGWRNRSLPITVEQLL
jgi:xanthine dehydrogenase YagR molybdenum-binding subunit